jgi:type I restriction enzyme S subunit
MSPWRTVTLGDLAESVNYGVTASAMQEPCGPKFLRITDIQDGAVNWGSVPWCECDDRSMSGGRLQAGDIVFARTGATTGKSYLIRDCPTDAGFASYLIRVRLREGAEPRYVSQFFQTPDYWEQIARSARGVAQPGVNATTLKALRVPLPLLPEQRRIAGVLDRAEALRAKRRAALAQLDTLTQAIFLDMFGDPVSNPKDVKVVRLADVATRITDGVHQKPNYTETGVPFISVKDVTSGRLVFDDCRFISLEDHERFTKRCKAERLDILYTKVGATYGRPALIETDREFSIYVSVCLIKPRRRIIDPYFLTAALGNSAVKKQADRRIKGIGVPDLHLDQIQNFLIPLPSMDRQSDFARCVEAVEKMRTTHRASLAELDALFASLQHRAFRGEL